jgi:sugar phosphate isomerase/epimerase
MIDDRFARWQRWNPILDVWRMRRPICENKVHPPKIAFDLHPQRALEALDHRPEFGFNFDPSHLHWQGIDSVEFIRAFPDRIYHVHVKDAIRHLTVAAGCFPATWGLATRAGWTLLARAARSISKNHAPSKSNQVLSIEWEDCGMDQFGKSAFAAIGFAASKRA